jgi:hypothetical protein
MPTLEAILGLLPVRLLVCVCAPVWRVHYLRIAGSKRPIEEVVSQGAPDYMSLAGLLSSNKDKPEPPPPPSASQSRNVEFLGKGPVRLRVGYKHCARIVSVHTP